MLMSARQPGLAKVYSSILGFQGDEFYIKNWPELVGVTFGEISRRFPMAIPIGLKSENGTITLKPSNKYVLTSTDEVVVIAEDDDTYKVMPMADVSYKPPPPRDPVTTDLERVLICGWRRDIRDMLHLLDQFCPYGSEVHLMNMIPLSERDFLLMEQGLNISELENITLVHHFGNSAIRKDLTAMPMDTFTSGVILADESREHDMLHSDSHTLASLLLLRDLRSNQKVCAHAGWGLLECSFFTSLFFSTLRCTQKKYQSFVSDRQSFVLDSQYSIDISDSKWDKARGSKCTTICEILDQRTEKTIASNATVSRKSDFVQSNAMISQILVLTQAHPLISISNINLISTLRSEPKT